MIRVSQPVNITTDASGDATAYSDPIAGKLHAIIYTKDDFTDGVDFTITDEDTGATLWTETNQNASIVDYPRLIAQGSNGADLTGWYVEPIVTGRVKIVVGSGGDTKSGSFEFVYEAY